MNNPIFLDTGYPSLGQIAAVGHDEAKLGPTLEAIPRHIYDWVQRFWPDLTATGEAAAQCEDEILALYGEHPEIIARAFVAYVVKMAMRDSTGDEKARRP